MPGLFVFLLATSLLRGVGDTVSPMLALLISTGTGLACTPALIAGWAGLPRLGVASAGVSMILGFTLALAWLDRKSTRLNSSHLVISYAVFCLKKKKNEYSVFEVIQQERV